MKIPQLCAALLATAFASAATADAAWKTITIQGWPGFTIDIPPAVNEEKDLEHLDPTKATLMAFFATSGDDDFVCFLAGSPYADGQTQTLMASGLATDRRNAFCESNDPHVSDGAILDSKSTTSSGFPAGTCVSSYTKSDEKKPGIVKASMTVAGPKTLYNLSCYIQSEDQYSAELVWRYSFQEPVAHIQESLRIPDAAQ